MPLTCAVTGSTGFVGRGICEFLQARDIAVRPVTRQTVPDFLDRHALGQAFENSDFVVHALGRAHLPKALDKSALDAFRLVNVEMTKSALEAAAAAGVRKFIHLSSVAVYGLSASETPVDESMPASPKTPYGVSKLEAEQAVTDFGRRHGLDTVIIRPPLIYGPDAPGNFARLVGAVRRGWPLPFGSTTGNRRTFLARDNLCGAILAALLHASTLPGPFIVADKESLSTRALIEAIAAGLGVTPRLFSFPTSLLGFGARLAGMPQMAEQLLGSLEFQAQRFSSETGWSPHVRAPLGLAAMGRAAVSK